VKNFEYCYAGNVFKVSQQVLHATVLWRKCVACHTFVGAYMSPQL